ncbi:MAG: PASTA domain-containing protein [Fibrobacter sp.]|nr:PASTA domain-containing protein [Fibrobacter sp.]
MIKRFLQKPVVYALIFWVVFGFLGFIAVDKILMPIIAGHLKTTVVIPDLVGKTGPEAELALDNVDLLYKWDTVGRYSTEIDAGSVLIQLPEAGRTVKKGRTIHLIVSKGLREVEIPELRGRSQRQAEISLNRLGLVQGQIVPGAHASIPRGVVIRTEPAAGSVVRVGQEVDIVISSGMTAGKIQLPNMQGLSLEKAKEQLSSLGFKLGNIMRKSSEAELPNTILTQHPRYGEYLERATAIDFVVAE